MKSLYLLQANFRREAIMLKRYLPNTISLVVTFYCIFLAMFFGIKFVGDPSSIDTNVQYVIVNYIFWYLAMMAMQDIGWAVSNEATLGTLEQLYMSPMGVWRILLARIISGTCLHLMIITILLYVSMLTTGTWLNIDIVSILPILCLTLISMFGVSFMIAGMSIIFKQIQAFLQILQFVFMGLTFVSLSFAPYLAFAPFVKGVDMVRTIMVEDVSISHFGSVDFLILSANALFYLVIGLWVFKSCERYAMRKGILGQH
ncbi:ABC transporter permease [Falsibacillus albus]|uniref:ABC transporter permease n=1 Tax=Falsibacillus albus TaxID=2478915 RepID=A0A3L7JSE7_9BACI|nr:ABC transporter permease [Falsibacillus albus]RLQ93195.1 ABC transporter permease [Falsibacillus albus]